MANQPGPLDTGGGTPAGMTLTGPAGTGTTAPASPPDARPGLLARFRSTLDGVTSRRALGWVLLAAWAVWLVALWVTQPRLVPADFLADELAQDRPTAYRLVTVDVDPGGGFSGPYRLDVSPVPQERDAEDGQLDDVADGRQVTVAYWVDAPVARLRVLDPNGLASEVPAALVQRLEAAGVPEAPASELWFHPSQRTYDAGALLLLVSTLVVIVGPRPRRGTRWFWFWVVGGPLSLGVPVFAVAELVSPRHEPVGTVHPSGVAGRWPGLAGLALGFLLSVAGAGALAALTGLSPIWFVHG